MTTTPRARVGGAIKPRRTGLSALLSHHTLRRLIQIGVWLFIAAIAVRHGLVGEEGTIVTASWEAYCPMGGLETLYKYITSSGRFVSHVHLSNVIVLVAALAVALLARNAFCGWICPFGFIQDMINRFSIFVQKRVPGIRKAVKALKQRGAPLAMLDHYLRFLKYGVLIWVVAGAAVYGFMVFRDYDPWAALWNLLELSLVGGTVVLAIVLIASLFVERPWCRYVCPLGAATGLLGGLSPFYLKREAAACKACAVCTRACPMGLPVHTATTIKHVDCIGCLECVDECPREGALSLKLGVPVVGQ
ncbi:MAG: 4Fe-4S binding protein [Anaerolineae bacterium]|nr:4Fe-4S binding protein [Anaerolineae bacterium]